MLAAVEQVDAVGFDTRAFAGKRDHGLIAADIGAAGHAECVVMGVCAQGQRGRGNVEGLSAILVQTHMVKTRAVTDRNDQRVMHLIGFRALAGYVALHQRCGGAVADVEQRTREYRRRLRTAGDVDDMQRLRNRGAIGDLDQKAIRHHRAVQRQHGIGVLGREQLLPGLTGFQRLAQGADAKSFF